MSFLEDPPFPGCPSFGFTSQPDYNVTVTTLGGGQEYRNANWSRPLYRHEVTVGPRMEDEIQELLEFWHAVGGMECGFRFKDHADFKSCRVNETPASTDQPLVFVDESDPYFQLTKRYTAGIRSQDRDIFKPVEGTILIADADELLTEGVHYEIDYTTGRVTLLGTSEVVSESTLTWGGQFDTPVRFDSPFPIELANKKIESVSFSLLELRL